MENVKIKEFLYTGDGSGSGSGSGSGYGYGDGSGSGYGYGAGSVYGSSSGDGYGSGYGCGYGAGSVYGSSSGDGYGSGYGCGYGAGSGYGSGDGYGRGYGYGSGIKSVNGEAVHDIDGIPTVLRVVHGNVAKGGILSEDMTINPCYIVKQGDVFAHGDTLREAMSALTDKLMEDMPEEERLEAFVREHKDASKQYPNTDFFEWHHRLTGSCEAGRKAFAKDHDIDVTGSMTVLEFIRLTERSYRGGIIRKLRAAYGLEQDDT